MKYERQTISHGEIERQLDICRRIFDRVTADGARPLAMVDTYGCSGMKRTARSFAVIWRKWDTVLPGMNFRRT